MDVYEKDNTIVARAKSAWAGEGTRSVDSGGEDLV
jgi:hypothetical protein